MWISVRTPMPACSCACAKVVGRGGGQQRARLIDPQRIGTLDLHDVGVPGDRPEGPVRSLVDPRDRCMGAQMTQRRMQAGFVGVGTGIGQYIGGAVHGGHAHRFSLCEFWNGGWVQFCMRTAAGR
jgi:hypothetical protein